jgi:hypothetical protein
VRILFLKQKRYNLFVGYLLFGMLPKVNPRIIETLQTLGYSSIEIKNQRVYARRRQDHIIIRLSRKDNPDFRIKAHQDFPTRTLPSHHNSDFSQEKRLIKEFRHAFRDHLNKNRQT